MDLTGDRFPETHEHTAASVRLEHQIEEQRGIQVRFRQIQEGTHPIRFVRSLDEMEIPGLENGEGEVLIEGTVTKNVDRILFDLRLSTEGDFECTRCLEPVHREIKTTLHSEFNPPQLGQNEEDSIHTYDPTGKPYIDLFDDVRDALALGIPMKVLCKPDCRGICAGCGHDLNREACTCPAVEESGQWGALKTISERLRADESKKSPRR